MTRTLARKLLEGEPPAIARCLTLIETGCPNARSILEAIGPRRGKAHVVGITGAPAEPSVS
jgi:LAO/AO transport system kinase